MCSKDKHLDHMLEKALAYQQDFYELLPDWIVYKSNGIKYLKQNIGRAIFGSPYSENNSNSNDIVNYEIDHMNDDVEINDTVHYRPDANQIINKIADQICEHGTIPGNKTIKCGVIYQIIIDDIPSSGEKRLTAVPLFKIQNYNDNSNTSKRNSKRNGNMYSTWYVDIKGRVYQGWENYITTNDLPKCTIVYPKDGFYQPDPMHKIRPNKSVVWVVAEDSYACTQHVKVLSAINKTVNVVGTGASIGLGLAALATPVGPIVATAGLVTSTATGLWNIGKCSADLYDRSVHKESISVFDQSALGSWLGIAGCALGIGVSGGSALLKNAAATGTRVGTIAKTAYNVTLISSVSVNLIGLGCQGFNMYKSYQEKGNVAMEDLLYFGTHLLFFSSSVINLKFANDIIKTTQGQILQVYEANLRSDNLQKRYNLVKSKAAATYGMDTIEQNAEIIRYINKFNPNYVSNTQQIDNNLQSSSNPFMIQDYKLVFSGITLLDPITFVIDLAKSYLYRREQKCENESVPVYTSQGLRLMKVVEDLLGDLYTSKDCPNNPQVFTTLHFRKLIQDLQDINCSKNILPFLFNVALMLVKASNNCASLVDTCYFIWDYIKENMREIGLGKSSTSQNLHDIVTVLFEAADSQVNRFLGALYQYINLRKIHKNDYKG